MKRFQTLWWLLGVMFILAGVLYWDDWATQRDEASKGQQELVFAVEVDQVQSLSYFDRDAEVDVTLERVDGVWQMIKPIQAKADASTVDSLLETLAEYRYQIIVNEDRESWREFGVDDEQAARVVRWQNADGTSQGFVMGFDTLVGFGVYFRSIGSDAVYSGSQYISSATSKTQNDFRDKSMVKLDPLLVRRVSYSVAGELLAEFGYDDHRYYFTHPVGLRADHAAVAGLLTDAMSAEATAFVDEPSSAFRTNFSRAGSKITVAWFGSEEQSDGSGYLEVAELNGTYYAKNSSDEYFEISPDTMRVLTKHLVDFRDRRLVRYESADVRAVEIDGTNFVKQDGDFYRIADDGVIGEHRQGHVDNLVMDLMFARALDFLDRGEPVIAESMSKPPRTIVRLQFSADMKRDDVVLRAWEDPTTADALLVDVSGMPNLFRIKADDMANARVETKVDDFSLNGSE